MIVLIFNTYYFYHLTIEAKSLYSYIALYITIGLDIIALTGLVMVVLVCVYFPYLKVFNTVKFSFLMLFAFPGGFFTLVGLTVVFFIIGFLFPYLIPMLLPGLYMSLVYYIYDKRLMKLVSHDGILPLDAFVYLNEYRSTKKSAKN